MQTPNLDAWLSQAHQSLEQARFDDARELCQRILAQQPNSVGALALLAVTEQAAGNGTTALQALARAQELAPTNAPIARAYTELLLKTGNDVAAIDFLEKMVSQDPLQSTFYDLLLEIYIQRDEFKRASAYFSELAAAEPRAARAFVMLSRLAHATGTLNSAVAAAERAVALDSGAWDGRYYLACALLKGGEFERALDVLKGSLQLPIADQERRTVKTAIADIVLVRSIRSAAGAPVYAPEIADRCRDHWELQAVSAITRQWRGAESEPRLNVVFFHVAWKDDHPFLLKEQGAQKVDYVQALMWACRAAIRNCPGARVFVLTDTATDLSSLPGSVAVLRLSVNPEQMMYTRLRAYRALMLTERLNGPIVFLDTDVILNRDFLQIFAQEDFDIGLTYRTDPELWHMPVNEGVILASSRIVAARFFHHELNVYDWLAALPFAVARYGFDARMWRGGQLALAIICSWRAPPFAPDVFSMGDLRGRFFPCKDYNFAVSMDDSPAFMSGKWALHFKGREAKQRMGEYVHLAEKSC